MTMFDPRLLPHRNLRTQHFQINEIPFPCIIKFDRRHTGRSARYRQSSHPPPLPMAVSCPSASTCSGCSTKRERKSAGIMEMACPYEAMNASHVGNIAHHSGDIIVIAVQQAPLSRTAQPSDSARHSNIPKLLDLTFGTPPNIEAYTSHRPAFSDESTYRGMLRL